MNFKAGDWVKFVETPDILIYPDFKTVDINIAYEVLEVVPDSRSIRLNSEQFLVDSYAGKVYFSFDERRFVKVDNPNSNRDTVEEFKQKKIDWFGITAEMRAK